MARKEFYHPFQPYDIQQQFMEAVYSCIEDGKVGIFESPTGTGKSLSLICASLTWLREHKRRRFEDAVAAIQLEDDEPGWMVEHARDQRRKEARQMRSDFEARLEAVRQKEAKVRERNPNAEPVAKRRKIVREVGTINADEDQFLLDDYESDDDQATACMGNTAYSSDTLAMLDKLGMLPSTSRNDSEEADEEIKIFFCSRTHSQLSQFVGELKRVRLPAGLPPENASEETLEHLKHLTLGSRKNLCINPKVNKSASQTAVNERCIELQQSNTAAEHKCPYLPKKDGQEAVLHFRDHALASIRDIEDLASVGSKMQICPYYASRSAIAPAEMITLPYPLLLQKSAREALGISLKGHVVIIDEAHNLMNAIEGIYSAQITEAQLRKAKESLLTYLQKFRNRLKGANRVYVTQVVRVVDSLLLATSLDNTKTSPGGIVAAEALLVGKGVDQINLAKLVRYINDSKLARKVEGYAAIAKAPTKSNAVDVTADVPTLTHVQNFLMCLMNPSKEGRFFLVKEQNTVAIKYLLLDPSEHFREVAESAKAVILAGGTMSPMEDYKQQLFPYVRDVRTLSCGHLIPPSNLLVRTIASDTTGSLEFSFKTRSDPTSAVRVGRALLGVVPQVKGGLVVFIPSYGYLEQVSEVWCTQGILGQLQQAKPVFSDSRVASAEDIFKSYSDAIKSNPSTGAILLSVIGGKLSEGINFSDDLGRCVIVVGLPFPNLETSKWKAKMEYLDQNAFERSGKKGSAGREHAENVCMRSVNQAIGRVIRHKDDWASILLMDCRYEQDRIRTKLPGWIKESMATGGQRTATGVEGVVNNVATFFANR